MIEGQRQIIAEARQKALANAESTFSETERLVRLTTIDDLWADYLAAIAEFRSGILWLSDTGL